MEQFKPPVDQNQSNEPAGKNSKEKNLEKIYQERKFGSALNSLGDGNMDLFNIRLLEFSDEEKKEFFISDEKTAEAVQKGVMVLIDKRPDDYILNIKKLIADFNLENSILHKSELQEKAKELLLSLIEEGDYYFIMSVQEMFGVSKEFLESEEAKKSSKKGFVFCVEKYNDMDSILKYSNIFEIPNEIWYSDEVKKVIGDKIIELLGFYNPDFDVINEFIDAFKISKEALKSPKFQDKAKKAIAKKIEYGELGDADLFLKMFGIPKDYLESSEIQEIFKKDYLKMTKGGDVDKCLKFAGRTQISDEVFYSEEAKENIENEIADLLTAYPKTDWKKISLLIDTFKISGENLKGLDKFHKPSVIAVENCAAIGKIEMAREIGKIFGIKEEFVEDLAKKYSSDKNDNSARSSNNATSTEKNPKETTPKDNESSEREKRQEKIVENVLKKGGFEGTMVYEWPEIVKGLERDGHQQMFHRINRETVGSPMYMMKYWMSEKDSGKLEDLMSENNINELVNVEYVEKPVYKKQIKNEGIFSRILHGKEIEQVFDHSERVKHSEAVENSKEEELAVKISYFVLEKNWITKPNGRAGQNLRVEIIMPESDANKIAEEIKNDPKFIRILSDEIMKNKILISPEEWEKDRGDGFTMRPPYKNWDQKGGKMCIMINEAERGLEKKDIREMKNY